MSQELEKLPGVTTPNVKSRMPQLVAVSGWPSDSPDHPLPVATFLRHASNLQWRELRLVAAPVSCSSTSLTRRSFSMPTPAMIPIRGRGFDKGAITLPKGSSRFLESHPLHLVSCSYGFVTAEVVGSSPVVLTIDSKALRGCGIPNDKQTQTQNFLRSVCDLPSQVFFA